MRMQSHKIRQTVLALLAIFIMLTPGLVLSKTPANQSTAVFYVA